MSRLFSWANRALAAIPNHVANDEAPAELDVLQAIQAHVSWKGRLQRFVSGTGEPLEAAQVASDCGCALGRWIYDRGAADHAHRPAFHQLKAVHAQFHRAAGDVVRAVESGERERAAAILSDREFHRHSEEIKSTLAEIFLERAS